MMNETGGKDCSAPSLKVENDNVVQMPKNRSGQKEQPVGETRAPTGGMSFMEQNAPQFQNEREYKQWLAGKVSRSEVAEDFRKLRDGMVYYASLAEGINDKYEALLRYLLKRGVIDSKSYVEHVMAQTNFKHMLDGLNGTPTKMEEKILALISWNEEHPEMQARGDYVRGLRDYLKNPKSGLTVLQRGEYASQLHIKEEDILTVEELEAFATELEVRAKAEPPIPIGQGAVLTTSIDSVEQDLLKRHGVELNEKGEIIRDSLEKLTKEEPNVS